MVCGVEVNLSCVFVSTVADTTQFGTQAEVTLQTNFFATRDMCNEFLPIIKPGGRHTHMNTHTHSLNTVPWFWRLESRSGFICVCVCVCQAGW